MVNSYLVWLISLYTLGIILYIIIRGKFRTFLTMLSAIVAPVFILFYIVAHSSVGSPSGQGYGAFGFAILLISSAPVAIPCCGYISVVLAGNLFQRYPNHWLGYVLYGAVLFIVPSIFFHYESFGPRIKNFVEKSMADNSAAMNEVYPINFAGRYLNLPCRREFHVYSPEKQCSANIQSHRDGFKPIDQLTISPVAHADMRYSCRSNQSYGEKNSLYCQFLPPENTIQFVIQTKQEKENFQKHYSAGDVVVLSKLGGLSVISEETKGPGGTRGTFSKLDLTKEYPNIMAYISCGKVVYGKAIDEYGCSIRLNFDSGLLAKNIKFSAAPDAIEAHTDQTVQEVSQYYDYLLKTYEAKSTQGN